MSERSYAYYPGCALHATAREYDEATRRVFERVGVELREIPGWTCCGASCAHAASKLLGQALPARNLQIAENMSLPVMTPCPACYTRLKFASHELRDPGQREIVSAALGHEFENKVEVLPILGALRSDEVSRVVRKPLAGLRVACYYGCMFVRPGKVLEFDDEENPQSMDTLLQAAGAETLDWAFKTECCGASMTIPRPGVVIGLSGRILAAARRLEADCIAVACPLCQNNLDQRQRAVSRSLGERVDIPVLYFTQLLGLAMGYTPSDVMLERNITDPMRVLRGKGIV